MSAAKRPRPISPHLQVYKPQITSVMSILHRITGVALAVGTILLVAWIVAVVLGNEAYDRIGNIVGSWFGRLLLFGWTVALFYHLANGIRHLFWDAGYGFELRTTTLSGQAVLVATVVLTLLAWGLGLSLGRG
jgi:succinate dehydrogenase / fumarate reductase cytochrome b subunit